MSGHVIWRDHSVTWRDSHFGCDRTAHWNLYYTQNFTVLQEPELDHTWNGPKSDSRMPTTISGVADPLKVHDRVCLIMCVLKQAEENNIIVVIPLVGIDRQCSISLIIQLLSTCAVLCRHCSMFHTFCTHTVRTMTVLLSAITRFCTRDSMRSQTRPSVGGNSDAEREDNLSHTSNRPTRRYQGISG